MIKDNYTKKEDKVIFILDIETFLKSKIVLASQEQRSMLS